MGNKQTVGIRLDPDKVEQIERLAKQKDISKSEAGRRLVEQGLEVSQGDVTVIYGKDEEVVTDGGQVVSKIESMERQIDDKESLAEEVITELESSGKINRPDYYLIALQLAVIFILSALSALLLQMGGIL